MSSLQPAISAAFIYGATHSWCYRCLILLSKSWQLQGKPPPPEGANTHSILSCKPSSSRLWLPMLLLARYKPCKLFPHPVLSLLVHSKLQLNICCTSRPNCPLFSGNTCFVRLQQTLVLLQYVPVCVLFLCVMYAMLCSCGNVLLCC